jgi:hypothetical protein
MIFKTIENLEVQMVFDSYPTPIRDKLMALRQLILDVASGSSEIGMIEETLKWGQISYLTQHPKSGTTIRIDEYPESPDQVAIFVHCQTTLVETFRLLYPNEFGYEGTRAVIFDTLDNGRLEAIRHCIELALTYHLKKHA